MKKSILVFYNARLVDCNLDSPGMIICSGNSIRNVVLGEFSELNTVKKIAVSFFSEKTLDDTDFIDCGGFVLMPSFIDMHAHFRYPGQTQKEDLDSGLNAAVAGGFGSLVLMPNTTPVISTAESALKVMKEANLKKKAQIFQTVSITKNFDGEAATDIDSFDNSKIPVITEDGNDVASSSIMYDAMQKAGKAGVIVSCHCEDKTLASSARQFRMRALQFMKKYGVQAGSINAPQTDIPDSVNFEIDGCLTAANNLLSLAEDIATLRNIEIAKTANCHVHICHCSTAKSINAVRNAKKFITENKIKNGFNCTVEVTPHHLGLTGSESPFLRALVNPPLRNEQDRTALIEAIKDGTVDVISTDHAPHTQEDKNAGAPGFTGLETAFAVCNTVLVNREGLSLSKLSELMSANPARILKMRSGKFMTGYDANFVLVDPTEIWIVRSANFFSKGKSTPLEGRSLMGKVKATFFHGEKVFPFA